MKRNDFILGSFFSLLILVFIGYFMFAVINENSDSGLTLKENTENLSDRVSLHYALKNVHEAETALNERGAEYLLNRETAEQSGAEYGSKNSESGAANLVTSIVTDYRGFDTLGEVTVLFISIIGVAILLFSMNGPMLTEPSLVVKTGNTYLLPIIMLVGAYVFVHGHLTPGGGFPGGTIIATGFLLMLLGMNAGKTGSKLLKVIESLAGLCFIGTGFAGFIIKGSFLQNFLPQGSIGSLFSAGFIMLIYIFIGIKVAAELSGGVLNIYTGGDDD